MKDRIEQLITRTNVPLEYDKQRKGNALVITCRGSFSLVSHTKLGELSEEVRLSDANRIVLDLREVVHIDSIGVGTIAVTVKDTMATSRRLLVVPNPQVHDLLIASSLDKVLEFADTVEVALASTGAAPSSLSNTSIT